MRVRIAGTACALVAGLGLASAAPAGQLAPADIQSTREPQGKAGVKGEGTWKLSKDGFCTTWKNSPQNCFTLVSAGDNKWSVMKGGKSLVGTWSK
jgi:hypothetical protein